MQDTQRSRETMQINSQSSHVVTDEVDKSGISDRLVTTNGEFQNDLLVPSLIVSAQ